MPRHLLVILTATQALFASALAAQPAFEKSPDEPTTAAPAPLKLEQPVTDKAEAFSSVFEVEMNARLKAIEERTGTGFLIVTLPDLGGQELEELGDTIINAWIDPRPRPALGALLLLAPNEREITYQLAFRSLDGEEEMREMLEDGRLEDALEITKLIGNKLSDAILPHFKNDDWEGGIRAAVDVISRESLQIDEAIGTPAQRRGEST